MEKQLKELKNPIYSNIFVNTQQQSNRMEEIDKILNKEKNTTNLPWNKLDKASKLQKLTLYADNYCDEEKISPKFKSDLKKYFSECLDRKKLQNNKEVIYNKEVGTIKIVPNLIHNKSTLRFTLKIPEKKTTRTSKLSKNNKKNNKIEIEKD
jgi:hypothetical protein